MGSEIGGRETSGMSFRIRQIIESYSVLSMSHGVCWQAGKVALQISVFQFYVSNECGCRKLAKSHILPSCHSFHPNVFHEIKSMTACTGCTSVWVSSLCLKSEACKAIDANLSVYVWYNAILPRKMCKCRQNTNRLLPELCILLVDP